MPLFPTQASFPAAAAQVFLDAKPLLCYYFGRERNIMLRLVGSFALQRGSRFESCTVPPL